MATTNQTPVNGLIFHSVRGVPYACGEFRALLRKDGVQQSRSRKGNYWDNAVVESFFKSLKVGWLNDRQFDNQTQAQLAVFEYIESYLINLSTFSVDKSFWEGMEEDFQYLTQYGISSTLAIGKVQWLVVRR